MVAAIIFIALWVVLFVPVVILPFLPQVDAAYVPALREFVLRTPQSLPDAQHDRAA